MRTNYDIDLKKILENAVNRLLNPKNHEQRQKFEKRINEILSQDHSLKSVVQDKFSEIWVEQIHKTATPTGGLRTRFDFNQDSYNNLTLLVNIAEQNNFYLRASNIAPKLKIHSQEQFQKIATALYKNNDKISEIEKEDINMRGSSDDIVQVQPQPEQPEAQAEQEQLQPQEEQVLEPQIAAQDQPQPQPQQPVEQPQLQPQQPAAQEQPQAPEKTALEKELEELKYALKFGYKDKVNKQEGYTNLEKFNLYFTYIIHGGKKEDIQDIPGESDYDKSLKNVLKEAGKTLQPSLLNDLFSGVEQKAKEALNMLNFLFDANAVEQAVKAKAQDILAGDLTNVKAQIDTAAQIIDGNLGGQVSEMLINKRESLIKQIFSEDAANSKKALEDLLKISDHNIASVGIQKGITSYFKGEGDISIAGFRSGIKTMQDLPSKDAINEFIKTQKDAALGPQFMINKEQGGERWYAQFKEDIINGINTFFSDESQSLKDFQERMHSIKFAFGADKFKEKFAVLINQHFSTEYAKLMNLEGEAFYKQYRRVKALDKMMEDLGVKEPYSVELEERATLGLGAHKTEVISKLDVALTKGRKTKDKFTQMNADIRTANEEVTKLIKNGNLSEDAKTLPKWILNSELRSRQDSLKLLDGVIKLEKLLNSRNQNAQKAKEFYEQYQKVKVLGDILVTVNLDLDLNINGKQIRYSNLDAELKVMGVTDEELTSVAYQKMQVDEVFASDTLDRSAETYIVWINNRPDEIKNYAIEKLKEAFNARYDRFKKDFEREFTHENERHIFLIAGYNELKNFVKIAEGINLSYEIEKDQGTGVNAIPSLIINNIATLDEALKDDLGVNLNFVKAEILPLPNALAQVQDNRDYINIPAIKLVENLLEKGISPALQNAFLDMRKTADGQQKLEAALNEAFNTLSQLLTEDYYYAYYTQLETNLIPNLAAIGLNPGFWEAEFSKERNQGNFAGQVTKARRGINALLAGNTADIEDIARAILENEIKRADALRNGDNKALDERLQENLNKKIGDLTNLSKQEGHDKQQVAREAQEILNYANIITDLYTNNNIKFEARPIIEIATKAIAEKVVALRDGLPENLAAMTAFINGITNSLLKYAKEEALTKVFNSVYDDLKANINSNDAPKLAKYYTQLQALQDVAVDVRQSIELAGNGNVLYRIDIPEEDEDINSVKDENRRKLDEALEKEGFDVEALKDPSGEVRAQRKKEEEARKARGNYAEVIEEFVSKEKDINDPKEKDALVLAIQNAILASAGINLETDRQTLLGADASKALHTNSKKFLKSKAETIANSSDIWKEINAAGYEMAKRTYFAPRRLSAVGADELKGSEKAINKFVEDGKISIENLKYACDCNDNPNVGLSWARDQIYSIPGALGSYAKDHPVLAVATPQIPIWVFVAMINPALLPMLLYVLTSIYVANKIMDFGKWISDNPIPRMIATGLATVIVGLAETPASLFFGTIRVFAWIMNMTNIISNETYQKISNNIPEFYAITRSVKDLAVKRPEPEFAFKPHGDFAKAKEEAKGKIQQRKREQEQQQQPQQNPEGAAVPQPVPNPVAAPQPAPNPAVVPQPAPTPVAAPQPAPNPAAVPQPAPNPAVVPQPAPTPVAAPQPAPNPAVVPQPGQNPVQVQQPAAQNQAQAQQPKRQTTTPQSLAPVTVSPQSSNKSMKNSNKQDLQALSKKKWQDRGKSSALNDAKAAGLGLASATSSGQNKPGDRKAEKTNLIPNNFRGF